MLVTTDELILLEAKTDELILLEATTKNCSFELLSKIFTKTA
jgi:hypothetical protein